MFKYLSWGIGFAGVILGLFACAPTPKSENACNFVQNVYGQRISWKDRLPVPLLVHSEFPREYISALQSAMAVWEQAAGRPLFQIVETNFTGNESPRQDHYSVVYWMKSWEASRPGEQARTSIYWVGDQIKEADLKVNAYNFRFYTNAMSGGGGVHLESLLIHELGHVLGLKHNDGGNSVMATYLAMQTSRDRLSMDDRGALTCEYL